MCSLSRIEFLYWMRRARSSFFPRLHAFGTTVSLRAYALSQVTAHHLLLGSVCRAGRASPRCRMSASWVVPSVGCLLGPANKGSGCLPGLAGVGSRLGFGAGPRGAQNTAHDWVPRSHQLWAVRGWAALLQVLKPKCVIRCFLYSCPDTLLLCRRAAPSRLMLEGTS